MVALSAYYDRVRKENPGLELEFDNGDTTILRPIALLNDVETRQLRTSYKTLEAYDSREDEASVDPADVRSEIVNLLAGVSTDKARTAAELDRLPLGVLMKIFEDWGGKEKDDDSPKSESGDGAPSDPRESTDG